MAAKLRNNDLVRSCLALVEDIFKLPGDHVWIDYDRGANVLYLSFRKPQRATKTVEADNDILVRKDGNKIVGITILNASAR